MLKLCIVLFVILICVLLRGQRYELTINATTLIFTNAYWEYAI
jgi:hypothetical protein